MKKKRKTATTKRTKINYCSERKSQRDFDKKKKRKTIQSRLVSFSFWQKKKKILKSAVFNLKKKEKTKIIQGFCCGNRN